MVAWDFHDLLQSLDLGRSLSMGQARELAIVAEEVNFDAGVEVFHEGDPPSGLFIVLSGEVEILKNDSDGNAWRIATLERNAVFGEMGLIADYPRSATARARTFCRLLTIPRERFARLLKNESLAAFKVVHAFALILTERLRRMDSRVAELMCAEKKRGEEEASRDMPDWTS